MKLFAPEALTFFRGLARNNARPWFEAHRDDYERHVKAPMADLVEVMDLRFARFAPEFVGDPRRSVFRLHRDIRFSRDKSPYKTHAACWFFHGRGSSKVGREAPATEVPGGVLGLEVSRVNEAIDRLELREAA